MADTVFIARCPEHGLHGARDSCFECGGPVEQVLMAPVEQAADDPREAGGAMFDAGDPLTRGQVMFDTRRAVLVEEIDTAVAHTTSRGEPGPDAVALTISGRINRPPDYESAGERPAEHVSHLHMLSWDAAADLIVDLQSLAARDGTDLTRALEAKWADRQARGLTRRAPDG